MKFSLRQTLWLFSEIYFVFLDNSFLTVLCIFSSTFFMTFLCMILKSESGCRECMQNHRASVVEEMKS